MDGFTIAPKPAAYVGIGAVGQLPEIVRATGADQVVVVTDAALAATPVIATVQAVLADAGIPGWTGGSASSASPRPTSARSPPTPSTRCWRTPRAIPPGAKSAPSSWPASASEKLVACPMGKAR